MSENKSWSSIGEEIRDAVQRALQDGDFSELGDAAVNTVSDTLKNVGNMVEQAVHGGNYTERMASVTRERKQAQAERERVQREVLRESEKNKPPFHPVGSVAGILFKVFGGIGTGIASVLTLLGLFLSFFDFFLLKLGLCMLAIFGFMIHTGIRSSARLKRARKYLELAGHNHYINIEDLALHTNQTPKSVRKDLKKMLSKGFFPEGHLDIQENCLMLDNKIYNEYLSLEKQRKIQEREKKAQEMKKKINPETENVDASEETGNSGELEAMIQEGQECIRSLRDMNDNISGEEISAKLFRLENLLKEIFERLREHPEQQPQMKKFMNYYLPTTLKLVKAYEEFDSMSVQGEDILEAKSEIEKTLNTINSAFEELLNRLFQKTAFDVTTDAQVLQTMLAKEGLTRQKEFEKVPR
ncbi:MAG: 5-bromo-4-chloroindolyl phosphate hydrolysis family protein [Acetatifactor sp.]